jgi:hypothetical protein
MAESPLYTHHQSGRRPLTLFAGLFCAFMVGFGLWKDAQWYAMAPMWAALTGVGWLLVSNPQSGAVLTPRTLRFYHGRQDRSIALADIASVKKHIWSEGPDEIILILKDGEEVTLPSQSIDRGFLPALEAAGVRRSQ